ncbi:MAG: hypothetical protein U0Q12_12850 [Vicinamibacterales bacterium]
MATISIVDDVSAEIVSANPQATSGLAKYAKGVPAQLIAGADVAGELRRTLALANPGENGVHLRLSHDLPLGTAGVALSISASAGCSVDVYNRTGMALFDTTVVGVPLKVGAGQAYIAISLRPTLSIGATRGVGGLTFGLDAGTEAELRCYRRFDLTGPPMTLAVACRDVLETYVIPNTTADLQSMRGLPVGTIACVGGHGHLQIGCAVDVAAAFNPLASVATLGKLGRLSAGAGASAEVAVRATVSGDFQVRVQRLGGSGLRLSYHKVATRELEVSVDAEAGPGVTLGDKDLLALLFSGPGGVAGAAEEVLVAGGVSQAQLDAIKTAMRAGLSRKVSLELGASLSSMGQDEAAFLYDIDLDSLDAIGSRALDRALAGDLVELNLLEPSLPAHGIAVLQSRTAHLRRRRVQWRVNLVGLVNVLSLTELVRTGSVFHDRESGELVVADRATTERVGARTESKALRTLLFESVMLSATYKAGGLDPNVTLSAAQSAFDFDERANRHRMADHLDAVAAVGLMDPDDIEPMLGAVDDFGRTSLLIDATFDQAACDRLFIDGGAARSQADYEDIGRQALLALVQERDPDAYRRLPMRDPALWKSMKDAGAARFDVVLKPPITGGPPDRQRLQVGVVASDYSLIIWWAQAMAAASTAIADLKRFLNGPPPVVVNDTDPRFQALRAKVQDAMVEAIQKNRTTFGHDPWGLVALFYASNRSADVTAAVVSPKLTLFRPE